MVKVGVLALQGAVDAHHVKLAALQVPSVDVRTPAELATCDALIMPGGESTTMLKLLDLNHLWQPLSDFVQSKPVWGICAGAILLARDVQGPQQRSLAAIDLGVERNAYGRQLNSFITKDLVVDREIMFEESEVAEGVFIRAPRFNQVGSALKPLVRYKDDVVMVRSETVLASAFHPELSGGLAFHRYFIQHFADKNRH